MFENGLLSKLFARKVGVGRKSKTACVYDKIINALETHNFRSAAEIKKMIEGMIRNTISLSAVKEFLHRHGFKCLKTGSLPAKADPEEQREFYEKIELPLMEKAKRKEIAMYFVDASHFVMGNGHLGVCLESS